MTQTAAEKEGTIVAAGVTAQGIDVLGSAPKLVSSRSSTSLIIRKAAPTIDDLVRAIAHRNSRCHEEVWLVAQHFTRCEVRVWVDRHERQ